MNEYLVKIRLPSNRVTFTKVYADSVATATEMLEAQGLNAVTVPSKVEKVNDVNG